MKIQNATNAVTATFRDYSTSASDQFMLDTGTSIAGFIFSFLEKTHPEDGGTLYRVGAGISRDTARQLGTDLLGWVSSGMTSTLEDVYYETVNGSQLYAACIDSICELVIKDSSGLVPPVSFEMNTDVTIDIGQRLIAFAGVDINAKMEV